MSQQQDNNNSAEVSEAMAAMLARLGITPTAAAPTRPDFAKAPPTDVHKFWGTQPVPQNPSEAIPFGPIEVKTVSEVKQDPYKLPEGFEWCLIDWENDSVLEECYVLLRDNYVEDDDAMFRFDYSKPFLRWALTPPNWKREWQIGVMQSSNKKIRAMITGTPQLISTGKDVEPTLMCEINFLCIHKKLRAQRLAPVLIKEVTRRVNLTNVFQAVYTAGVAIPTPIGVPAKYWHRSLNPKKLIDIGFSSLGHRQTLQRLTRLLQLPDQVSTPGWRPMEERDLKQCFTLLKTYLAQFRLHVEFQDLEEMRHVFLPQAGVISSYVVENKKGQITDFASFYHLYSTIMKSPKYKTLRAAYSFYNAPGSLSMEELYANLLIEANKQEMDVFNALDLMKNRPCFEPLKFGIGDGNLHYYLYNYSMGAPCNADQVGIVLV